MAAREKAERPLAEAQETIRELTQLVHARRARDKAIQRADEQKPAGEDALALLQEELLAVRATLQQQIERRLQRRRARPAEDLL
jgi:hypothetical protein